MNWISAKDEQPRYGLPCIVVYHGVIQETIYYRDIGQYIPICDCSDPMPESFVSHYVS